MNKCIYYGRVRATNQHGQCLGCQQLNQEITEDNLLCLITGGHDKLPDGSCKWCDE